jgi:chromosome segregation ATPase
MPASLDHTITELQAQIDQLSLALHQWRTTQDHLEPMEQRLSELTDRLADILNRWAAAGDRHASAIGQVEDRINDWSAIEARLQRESAQRLKELETTIEHEWKALRQMHEEPIRQLREQATALGETCVSAANLALKSFEKAETRIAALEADLQSRLDRLSDDVRALAERSTDRQSQLPPGSTGVAPFALDEVMKIHAEMRQDTAPPAAPALVAAPAPRQLPEPSVEITQRLTTLEREVESEREEVRATATRAERLGRTSRLLIAALVVALLAGGVYAVMLQQRVTAELNAATERATAAERQVSTVSSTATQEIAAAREEAARQIADAQRTARLAQISSNVLAAPDLVRLTLAGTSSDAIGHVHWSRSQGLILNVLRLPPPPAGSVHQVWFLGPDSAAVSAGFLGAAGDGRSTLIVENPDALPRPVTGIIVTVEPDGGSQAPTGVMAMTRAPQPPQ